MPKDIVRTSYRPIFARRQGGPKGTCSALVERFAFPENELALPEVGKVDRDHCRGIVHELARCLARHGVGRSVLMSPRDS